MTSFQAFNRLLVYDRERKTLWKVRKLVYTTLEARKSNLWRNVVEKAGSRPLFQPLYWLLQKQDRKQQFMYRSHLMRRHLLVHMTSSLLSSCSLAFDHTSTSKSYSTSVSAASEFQAWIKLVSLDDILNWCDYYVFFELNKRSFNKILNAENTEPVIQGQ